MPTAAWRGSEAASGRSLGRLEASLSCNERGHRAMIAIPLAINWGSVAVNVGSGFCGRCNHCGHGPPFIAIRTADDCGPQHLDAPGWGQPARAVANLGSDRSLDRILTSRPCHYAELSKLIP
jgi:hypothetical protein